VIESMTFNRKNRRGNFGSVMSKVNSSVTLLNIFRKIEQVKNSKACSNPQRRKPRR
jgi:hypothetical protein